MEDKVRLKSGPSALIYFLHDCVYLHEDAHAARRHLGLSGPLLDHLGGHLELAARAHRQAGDVLELDRVQA